MVNKRMIVGLRKRTLTEHAVLFTLCGLSAAIFVALVVMPFTQSWPGVAQLTVAGACWSGIIAYLWVHFRLAARNAEIRLSSTGLFKTIQYLTLTLAAVPLLIWSGSHVAFRFFTVLSFGAESFLGVFLLFYLLLALSYGLRPPRPTWMGFAYAVIGALASYRKLISTDF